MSPSEFTLKTMPPRVPRAALNRERLMEFWNDVHERTALLVVAPAGFGKTTLLLQWRRRWLADGALVAWLSADDQDDPARFTMALLHAVRAASGQPTSADAARLTGNSRIETLTGLLSEIADRGLDTVLVIDDAERLPQATLDRCVQYLLLNAPANLHVAIGSRVRLPLQTAELVAKGNLATLGADDLRLRLEESLGILEGRLGQRLGVDECARLHDITQGWPIGLQLAISTIEHEADPATAVRSLSARHGTLQEYFVELLLAKLDPRLADFLTRIAILDELGTESCAAVTGCADAASQLAQLIRETPMVIVGEHRRWIRLHPMARDFLLGRFEQLPTDEQHALHARASHWLAGQERFHEAASHAWAAGNVALAQAYATQSLWTLGTQGKYAEAREWLDRIPADMFAGNIGLRLAAAMILTLGDRNAEALRIAREVIDDPATTLESLVVALRVFAASAAHADQLGLLPELLARWPELPAGSVDPLYVVSGLNTRALVALHAGATGQVRELMARAAVYGDAGSLRLAATLGRMLVGMAHLRDGDAEQAEATLHPALARIELEEGRRSMLASLIASVLAAALMRRDQPAAAQAMLANRLDVIERCGFPDNVLLAYRTLIQVALSQADERRALNLLDSLDAVAERRRLPRLRLHALAHRIRIHALRGRTETVDSLLPALTDLAGAFENEALRPFLPEYRLTAAFAGVYAALARNDLDEAERELEVADAIAAEERRGRDALTAKVLRAVVAGQRDNAQALPLLREALDLAAMAGDARLLADAHPLALQMAAELKTPVAPAPPAPVFFNANAPVPARHAPSRSGLLTSKEAEILGLLEKGLPNKLIARTLDISGETVKWHLKNLFNKLSAGTRKHAVDRARLLGLVQQQPMPPTRGYSRTT